MKNFNLIVSANVLFFLALALSLVLHPEGLYPRMLLARSFGPTWFETQGLSRPAGGIVALLALLLSWVASEVRTPRARRFMLAALTALSGGAVMSSFILQNHMLQNPSGFVLLLSCLLLTTLNALGWIRRGLLSQEAGSELEPKPTGWLPILLHQALRALAAVAAAVVAVGWIAPQATRSLLVELGGSVNTAASGLVGVFGILLVAIVCALAFGWPETRDLWQLERMVAALRLGEATSEGTMATPVPQGSSLLLAPLTQAVGALAGGGGALQATRQRWLRQLEETAATEERNRLARELHDSIKQQLFSIKMSAAASEARWDGDPPGARKSLADVRRCAHEAMVEMQSLLLQLRPEALANVGLVEALKEQCEALQYRTGATVTCHVDELPPESKLPPAIQQALFRIAQEAMSNIARHARAKAVTVDLRRQGAELVLRIEDDGQGFDLQARPSGLGLQGIAERLEAFQGRLDLGSSPGEGTQLRVHVPLEAPSPRPAETPKNPREAVVQAFSPAVLVGLCLALSPGIMPGALFSQEVETQLSSWLFPGLLLLAGLTYGWHQWRQRSTVDRPVLRREHLSLRLFLLFAAAYCWAPHFWWTYSRADLATSLGFLALSVSAGFLGTLSLLWITKVKGTSDWEGALAMTFALIWLGMVLFTALPTAFDYSFGFFGLSMLSGLAATAIYLGGIVQFWAQQQRQLRGEG